MSKVLRILAAGFGAVLFGIIVPVVYLLVFEGVPFGSLNGFLLLVGAGLAVGACLGALFPRVFGFIFEMFMDV
jgi:hypothetical protein